MSTSTQSEGTEANLSENTSEQSDGKAKMTVDEYQIVAVAPVEFFTPKRLDHFISKYDDKEKARVETLESYIKELTNFDYKIFVEQIDINDLEKIDGKSPRFDTDKQNKQIEEVINIKEIVNLIERKMSAKKYSENILGREFVDKINESINEFFSDEKTKQNYYLNNIHKIAKENKEELQNLMEYNINYNLWAKLKRKNSKDYFWCELKRQLIATIPQNDKVAIAQIELLIAEAKVGIQQKKPIDQIFGNRYRMSRRSRDLPDVRSVLREAAKELHKHAKYDIDDNFWNELEQDLGNVTLNDDNKTADKIKEVIAEAKANIDARKPIDQIFGNRYSMSRSASDLPDVHTVLSDAERKLRERVKYDDDINLWNKFWNELEQDLGNVTLNDDNKTADKIKEVIAEAKANIDAEKPIDQIFDNRYKMSRSLRDLPDVRSVLRDAERKLHENTNYDIDNDFWDNLKTNLKSVTSDDDKIVAKINESVTEAEANWRDQKSIDKIFGRGGILFPRWQGLPDVRSVLRDAERKLRERVKYDDDINLWNKFWNELEQDLGNVTLNDDNKTADKIKEVIAEAKANIDARKPIDQIFDNRYSMSRSARELPDVHTVLGNFKKRISITYYNDKSKLHRFIKSLEKGIESLNDELLSYDKLIFEVYRRVNEKLEVFGNKLTPLDTKQDDTNNHKIQENLEKINRDSNIEDNINKIEDMLRNTPSEEMEEMEAKIYEKLNELYNFSAFNDNDNSNAYDKNTKNYFLDKLPKYLLIEEILSDPKFELDASNIKSVDILVAIPRNPNNEKTTTEIVFLLVIDINLEENRELVPEDFKIGEMLFDPFNVRTILNLVFNRFFIENKESHFNKLLDNKSFISNSSILHIISCPNFGTDDNTQELSWRQKDFIKEIIPGLLFDHVNPENSELKYIHRKNFKSSDAGGVSSALVLYLKQLLAISDQNSLAPEDNRDKVIGLQIVLQVFLQRLIQFNDALRSIAIEENRKNLFDGKDDFKMFSNQLHYTYTISDEVINSSRQHSDIAVLRDLLASDTIINQIKIFKERRQTFFSTKENFENWQRDSIIQWSLVGLAVITIVFSILELSNKADFVKLLIALGIISFLAVIFMWKFSVFKKIKHIYTSIKSKIFSK